VSVASRPRRLVVVAGTGTEVGKTWVAAHVLRELRASGTTVAARKPAQSFSPADHETDAHVLAAASEEPTAEVCPKHRWYELPMAPPMAAEVLGRTRFSIDDLVAELAWPAPKVELGLVEAAGGVRSPLADDGDTVSLIEAVQPDVVVLVADAGLGTINAVRLSLEALDRGAHLATLLVHLNRYDGSDELHRANRAWLAERHGLDVEVTLADLAARLRGLGPEA
jgi:dethiobiotin synthetase